MTTYIFYRHNETGAIATLVEWLSDCPEDWVTDGKLEPITLLSDDDCYLTPPLFYGCFMDAEEGEEYLSEWACHARDEEGNTYRIIWRFPVIKGEEPDDDCLPWEDDRHIYKVEAV